MTLQTHSSAILLHLLQTKSIWLSFYEWQFHFVLRESFNDLEKLRNWVVELIISFPWGPKGLPPPDAKKNSFCRTWEVRACAEKNCQLVVSGRLPIHSRSSQRPILSTLTTGSCMQLLKFKFCSKRTVYKLKITFRQWVSLSCVLLFLRDLFDSVLKRPHSTRAVYNLYVYT